MPTNPDLTNPNPSKKKDLENKITLLERARLVGEMS